MQVKEGFGQLIPEALDLPELAVLEDQDPVSRAQP